MQHVLPFDFRQTVAEACCLYAQAKAPIDQSAMARRRPIVFRVPMEYLRLEQSPAFQALARQQEEAILQNASATGGLRGGNVQGALAQFRPALLNQFLEQQYGRLGGMTALGQQSAAGVGTAGMQSATSISNLLAEGGAARAGAKLGSANAWQQSLSLPAQFAGMAIGRGY